MIYAAHNNMAIYGMGSSPERALLEAGKWTEFDMTGIVTSPCTDAIVEMVIEMGGAIDWTINDGVMDVRTTHGDSCDDQAWCDLQTEYGY